MAGHQPLLQAEVTTMEARRQRVEATRQMDEQMEETERRRVAAAARAAEVAAAEARPATGDLRVRAFGPSGQAALSSLLS